MKQPNGEGKLKTAVDESAAVWVICLFCKVESDGLTWFGSMFYHFG